MDKRYQVFVSSTYEDLRDERQEVMQALLELDCIPAGMELFPAANEDQWTLIKKVIDDCDYYIVVIGGRYGSLGSEGISYTQMEYEYAVLQNKPVMGFLHKDPSSISAKKSEKSPEGLVKLEQFRSLVQQKMCKYWSNPAELGSAVSRSLVKLIKNVPAVGWVKADLLPDKSATEEILRLRQKIEDLQNQLSDTQQGSPISTENLSQGDDIVKIKFSVTAYKPPEPQPEKNVQPSNRSSFLPPLRGSGSYKTYHYEFEATWNNLFFALSPFLIDEASDTTLTKVLNNFIAEEAIEELKDKEELNGCELQRFTIDGESFNTIKVQFLALNLIAKSAKRKNRSVSDVSAYWTLTPYGENAMMVLRAIRKQPDTNA